MTDNLTARMAELRAREKAANSSITYYLQTGDGHGLMVNRACAVAEKDTPTLLAALEAVVAVHAPVERKFNGKTILVCLSCWNPRYPCPTITAVTDAMGDA